jgi:hypothetical protein
MLGQKGIAPLLIIISLTIFGLLLVAAFLIKQKLQPRYYFPPTPTQDERDAAKKLPQDQCGCWYGVENVCHPQADCI